MQQGIKAEDTLWLRFKYYSFFDLDPKVRHGSLELPGVWSQGGGSHHAALSFPAC